MSGVFKFRKREVQLLKYRQVSHAYKLLKNKLVQSYCMSECFTTIATAQGNGQQRL